MRMKTSSRMRENIPQSGNAGMLQTFTTMLLALCVVWVGSSSTAMANPGYLGQRKIGDSAEALYKRHCSVCHGDRGNGGSRAKKDLVTPPRDFSSATNLTRKKMIFAVQEGKATTAMMGWRSRLTEKEIEDVVDYIRGRFMLVAIDPRIAQGRGVYGHFCQVCHGDRGQGVQSPEMAGTPHDLTLPKFQAGLTRERMLNSVSKGKHGSVKAGFADTLSAEHVSAVVDYMRQVLIPSLPKSAAEKQALSDTIKGDAGVPQAAVPAQSDMSQPLPKGLKGNAQLGEKFFMANCATCHGKKGDAQGPRAYFINPKVRNLQDDYSRKTLDRPTIFSSVTNGRPGTEMPAWGKVLSEQEIANVTEFVFQAFIQPNIGTKASAK